MARSADIHWLAGYLEGEGSFVLHKSPSRPQRYVMIQIDCTDRDVIERAAKILGTKVHVRMSYKGNPLAKLDQVYVRMTGLHAKHWCEKLYPLMGSRRRAQIEKVLAGSTQ